MDTNRWTDAIDRITEAFKNRFGLLTVEQLNWKPNQQIDSVAQILKHLVGVNGYYLSAIEGIRNKTYATPWFGRLPFVPGILGSSTLKGVQPGNRKPIGPIAESRPAASSVDAGILDRFENQQVALKKLIRDSDDLLARRTIVSSHVSRNIVYSLHHAYDIIVAHEQSHFDEASELLALQMNHAMSKMTGNNSRTEFT